MKSIRIPMFSLILVATVMLAGCAQEIQNMDFRYVDVYINEDCIPSTLAKDGFIETLWVFPGDKVTVTNTRDKKIEIKFPAGMFDKDAATLEPGKRIVLKVLDVSSQEGVFSITDGDDICPDGTPKVVIGEGP